jgi:hypothetical protein
VFSVEALGVWCTKGCYCPRKLHNMAKEHVFIAIVLYRVYIDVYKRAMDLTGVVNV